MKNNNKELESHGPEKAGGHFTTSPKTGYTETLMKGEAMKEDPMKRRANRQPTISVDIYFSGFFSFSFLFRCNLFVR